MLATLDTNKKFTVIFSAFQATEDSLTNYINTERLARFLELVAHVDYSRGVPR